MRLYPGAQMKCPRPSVSPSMLVPSPGMISFPSLRMVSHSFPVSLFPCSHQVGGKILNGSTKGVELSPVAPGWLNLNLLLPCMSTMWRGWDRLTAWKIQGTVRQVDGVVKSGRYLHDALCRSLCFSEHCTPTFSPLKCK